VSVVCVVDGLYQLHELLGKGGIGAVYRATNRMSGDVVALKLLHGWQQHLTPPDGHTSDYQTDSTPSRPVTGSELTTDAFSSRLSFAREFQTLASLHHPNVVQVLNHGFDMLAGPYFTMELLPAPKTILEAGEQQPMAAKIDLLVQLLRAVSYLHRRQIIHRDLKPTNVLTVDGRVKVVDFGIALAKADAPLAGTLGYIAPEVFLGGVPSITSDLYSVGVIAYQLLSGRFPYGDIKDTWTLISRVLGVGADHTLAGPVAAAVRRLLGQSPMDRREEHSDWTLRPIYDGGGDRDPVTAALDRIVIKLLAPTPEARHISAEDVIRDLCQALGRDLAVETGETRESLLQAAEFVGRSSEMSTLLQALDRARAGAGSAWLIGGESGVGKSRLVDELRTLALVNGAQVVRSRAIAERGGQLDLWTPVLRTLLVYGGASDYEAGVLKAVIPDAGELLGRPVADAPPVPPIEAQRRFFNVVGDLLARYGRPLVILFEDLQWAANDSLALLDFVSRIVSDRALLLVANFRDDEAPGLPESLPEMRRMKLGRLSEQAVGDLTRSILGAARCSPGLVRFLQRETEGNVFFLVETLRALAEEAAGLDNLNGVQLPERIMTGGIEQILQRRLERVPADQLGLGLLQAAAVAGRQIDLQLLRAVTGARDLERWLRVCANSAVLEVQAGEWLFAHDKLRERVLADLAEGPTRALHLAIAGALETLYPGASAKFPSLAHHYQRAGDYDKACDYFIKSGNIAARLFATLDARKHYGEAIACFAQLPGTEENRRRKVDVTTQLIAMSWFAQAPKHTVAQIDQAETLLGSIERARWAAADHLRAARLGLWGGRGCYARGAQIEALQRYRRGLDAATQAANPQITALLTGSVGQALGLQGQFAAARPYLEEAQQLLAEAGEWPDWCRVRGFSGMNLGALGDFAAGHQLVMSAIDRINELNYSTYLASQYIYLAGLYCLAEDWERCGRYGREVVKSGSLAQDWVLTYMGLVMWEWSLLWLGDIVQAGEVHREAVEVYARIEGSPIDDWFVVRDVDRAFLGGRLDEALQLAQAAVARCHETGYVLGLALAHRSWGRALAAHDRHDEAAAHMAESVRAAALGNGRLLMARTHLAWAELCRQRRDGGGVEEHTRLAAL
jgi:serine/threonine protein kinase/tetratricopeptide (TPR) repeat protein